MNILCKNILINKLLNPINYLISIFKNSKLLLTSSKCNFYFGVTNLINFKFLNKIRTPVWPHIDQFSYTYSLKLNYKTLENGKCLYNVSLLLSWFPNCYIGEPEPRSGLFRAKESEQEPMKEIYKNNSKEPALGLYRGSRSRRR